MQRPIAAAAAVSSSDAVAMQLHLSAACHAERAVDALAAEGSRFSTVLPQSLKLMVQPVQ